MGKRQFSNKKASKSNRFEYDPKTHKVIPKLDYPVFCLKHIKSGFDVSDCSQIEQAKVLTRLRGLGQMTWLQIQQTPREGWGTEKISVDSLKERPTPIVTQDVDSLLALRFGDIERLLVLRDGFFAHIIFIDPKGKVYNH